MAFCVCFVDDTRAKNELKFGNKSRPMSTFNKLIFNRYLRRWKMTFYSILFFNAWISFETMLHAQFNQENIENIL